MVLGLFILSGVFLQGLAELPWELILMWMMEQFPSRTVWEKKHICVYFVLL